MDYRSLSISFRIQLGFHAANNEGSGGTNVMEPRRITVGDKEYDGISGEIVRRHILENFVKLCEDAKVPIHNRCKGLIPDRGREALKGWMRKNAPTKKIKKGSSEKEMPILQVVQYPEATEYLIKNCALCDVGGFLIALEQKENFQGTLKRDSTFEVGWLITEHPAIVDYTQHSAYYPDQEHGLFVQNMRVGIYGGVIRIDLDRIGFNDWWWLNPEKFKGKRYIDDEERKKRIKCLLDAIEQWLISPSFAKQTGWLQHMSGLLEGVIVLSKNGAAPFYSPIKFELENNEIPVIKPNEEYREILEKLGDSYKGEYKIIKFDKISNKNNGSSKGLKEAFDEVLQTLKLNKDGDKDGKKESN